MDLPARIGEYRVIRELARGGMGRVLLAEDDRLRRQVVIKRLDVPVADGGEQQVELRFFLHREARALAQLNHPNIMRVYDYSGPGSDVPYLVCEHVEGRTLRHVLDEGGALPAPLALCVAYEMARALLHAHATGVVHRDIKPENVLWTEAGRVVVIDFGIAKALDSGLLGGTVTFGATRLYGSPSYMAPELFAGDTASTAADWYALGCVLFEMLTGEAAFGGHDVQSIMRAVSAGRRCTAPVPREPAGLAATVDALLHLAPATRLRGADAVRTLRALLDAADVADPRSELYNFGTHTHAVAVEDDVEPAESTTRLFAPRPAHRISAPRSHGLWAALAQRGPFAFSFVAVALLMAAGAYMFDKLREMTGAARSPPPALAAPAHDEVTVSVVFAGTATLFVDGVQLGTWSDAIRFTLTPGRHRLRLESDAGAHEREVLVVEGSEPTYDFRPPATGQ